MSRFRDVRLVERVVVTRVTLCIGDGDNVDPVRLVQEWWDDDGGLIYAEPDEYAEIPVPSAGTDELRRHPNAKLWECKCGRWYDHAGPGPEPGCPYCLLREAFEGLSDRTGLKWRVGEFLAAVSTEGGGA